MKYQRQKAPLLWIVCLFMCTVISFDVICVLIPDKEFSQTENRMLAQSPAITYQGISDGSLAKQTEKYLSDQFAFRDIWSSLTFLTRNRIFRQQEINSVYIGKDHFLMLRPSEPSPENLRKKLASVNAVAGRYENIHQCMAIIPNAVTIFTDKLPAYTLPSKQPEQIAGIAKSLSGISFCDVTQSMKAVSDSDLYYHTDHHWTSLGAYTAFRRMAVDMKIDPDSTEFIRYTVSDTFQGTLASKSGCYEFYDKIDIYTPKEEQPLSIKYSDSGKSAGTLYEKEQLNAKDQYALFLGGNHPIVTITTTADTSRSLMLIKDSYANCFVQFLTPYFDQIILVDPRYCYDTIDLLINEYEITDILYLYNADTFMTDTSLTDFLTLTPDTESEELQ